MREVLCFIVEECLGKARRFRHKAVGTSEEQEKSQDDCLALRKAARADGLRSRIMHGRSRLVTLGQMEGEAGKVGARRRADSR